MNAIIMNIEDIRHGTRDRKIHALFSASLWFVAGAYITSSLAFYILPTESLFPSLFGGTIACCAALYSKSL
jgi:hypothetical protein